jgi:hypothetical protein
MAKTTRTTGRLILILKVVAVLVAVLTTWRLSIPSLQTSPEALNSFRRKVNKLQEAHKKGVPLQVRISAIELNSDLDDWYRRMHIDIGWPPWGTVFYFKGDRAHAYIPGYMPGNVRVAVADVWLYPRGNVVYPRLVVVWLGIVPVPGPLFGWAAKVIAGKTSRGLWGPQRLPDLVRDVRIENGEAVVETR